MNELIRTILAVLFVLVTTEVFSDEGKLGAEMNGDIEARKKSVANKIKLLGRLIQQSPTAQRIRQSDNEGAKDLLVKASTEWQLAAEDLEFMNIEDAEKRVKQGLILMTHASSFVADTKRLANIQEDRYQKLKERITSFSTAFQRIALEKQSEEISALLDLDEIEKYLNQADILAQKSDYQHANQILSNAADKVEIALAQARHKETLLHDLTFDSPAQEYHYEKQRNHSYMLLADVIKTKKKIEPSSLDQFRSVIEENEKLRKQADMLASDGKTEEAIKLLEQGTNKMARTLRASGVVF